MFDCLLSPGSLDKNPPHRLRRGGKEVAAIVPQPLAVGLAVADQPQISFVDQRRGLQRLSRLSWASFCAASRRSSS